MISYFVTSSALDSSRLRFTLRSQVHTLDPHQWSTAPEDCLDQLRLCDVLIVHSSDPPLSYALLGWWLHRAAGTLDRTVIIGEPPVWTAAPIESYATWADFIATEQLCPDDVGLGTPISY